MQVYLFLKTTSVVSFKLYYNRYEQTKKDENMNKINFSINRSYWDRIGKHFSLIAACLLVALFIISLSGMMAWQNSAFNGKHQDKWYHLQ